MWLTTRTTVVTLFGAGFIVAAAGFIAWSGTTTTDRPVVPEKMTVGASTADVNALMWFARDKGLFERAGLDPDFKTFEAGIFAVDALLRGEVDIATTAEFVVVKRGFARPNLRILASVTSADNGMLVVRRDSGVRSPADLAGRTIGVTMGSAAQYFLGGLLQANGLTEDDVSLLNGKPSELAEALTAGRADAALLWDPSLFELKQKLGDDIVVFPAQSYQDYYFTLVTTDSWASDHRELSTRFIEVMLEAQRLATEKPNVFAAFITEFFGYSAEYTERIRDSYRFAVTLPQALLPAMEEQARWMIGAGLVDAATAPNYLDFLDAAAMRAADESVVSVAF